MEQRLRDQEQAKQQLQQLKHKDKSQQSKFKTIVLYQQKS